MSLQTDNFVKIAREYCAWAEGSALEQEADARMAIHLIASLYSSVLALSMNECGEDVNAKEVTDEEWRVIYKRFSSLPFNYYSVSFSPANIDEKPVTGDLADDLSDI